MTRTVIAVAIATAFAAGCGGSDDNDNSGTTPPVVVPPVTMPSVTTGPVRTTTALTKDWRFVLDDTLTEAQALGGALDNG